MKEKPSLRDQYIVDQLREAYGVDIARVEFLPIGDISSAKYRLVTQGPNAYFLKLKKGGFKETSVAVPDFLHEQGMNQVLSPLKTGEGRLWTDLDAYTCILYPFVAGQNAFQNPLSEAQWLEFGAALRGVHSVNLPSDLRAMLPAESFASIWRETVKRYLVEVENHSYEDPVAAGMAAGLQAHRDEIHFVIDRAGELGMTLQSQPLDLVLCHTDIHAGNLLLETDGALHMTDWDDPMLAPKERDLMFIDGGIGGIWNTAREEELFYRGYGEEPVNLTALAYYRYERIVSDIAEFSQQILSTTEGGADRERSLQKFPTIFLPGQVLEMAHRTDQRLKGGQGMRK